jgi:aspartate/methionine/tyrosine aminotransferase
MKTQIADRLKNTEEYYFSKKLSEIERLNRSGEKVINLGIGSPDLAPPLGAIETLIEEVQNPNNHAYQNYKGILPFRKAIADWYDRFYGVSLDAESEVLPLMGSKEGIMHICMTYLQEGDECLIPNPGYPTYQSAVRLSGAKAVFNELNEEGNWLPNLEELEKLNLDKVKIMWINYPHMPTGGNATSAFFEKLIAFAKKHQILICHDNPYSFIMTEKPSSILSIPGAKEVAIELNSLSKTFNMAGWRMGMLLTTNERILEILRFKSNMDSGMFLPLQKAAIQALSVGKEWYEDLNKVYKKRRTKVFELLDLLDCQYNTEQVGLFVWASIPSSYTDGYALSDEVLNASRVFITPGGIFGTAGDKYVRVSLCSDESVFSSAIQRLKEAKQNKTLK